MAQLNSIKQKTHELNTEVYALYLAYRDSRVKWYVRLLLAVAISYAVSPIDFIPDLTAVFGFLDDIVVVALGLNISYQLLSKNVLGHARLQAFEEMSASGEHIADAYKIIGYVWAIAFAVLALVLYKFLHMSMF
ncbi:YkvA family protein [Pontibacter silvestris]|uniref:YkvA family protein n=1 Tax=Pontibacter silvestris TaxID=2305183 RepID=A0ABW4X2Q4_9BACT|nr:YkvA family protein [Pontibacter silvestris]MCC9137037.1 DUF1232 domain-containing protein [Pontibacter silvestris]